ncbi:MORC family CW-type zinc finger protein 3-like [Lineus longissimus]|uniref:MORC family CW-type zinc finger protein 3-like n=1 Tax=Lineus longissimus TaxID=88925 RepID=UPI002B4C2F62
MASAQVRDGIRLSKMSPSFLHGNSTSHTWAFSAIAEIIDNAYDPDANAKTLTIDKVKVKNHDALVFMDNGNGMSTEKLHHMLSFGYCEKKEVNGHAPVGHYGNGFKSGSMRLGKSAIVFTIDKNSLSVGLLSQTYLKKINSDTVIVPIVTWCKQKKRKVGMTESLNAILNFTFFETEEEVLEQFDEIMTQPDASPNSTGTLIMLYELKRGSDNRLELDFESDGRDIINSEHHVIDTASQVHDRPVREYVSTYRKSLREYCSILYLKPRMKIVLRGKKVKTKFLVKTLRDREVDSYKPKWLNDPVKVTFGFNDHENDYGVMLYNKNRLIKAYERVGYQKQSNGPDRGIGIVGIVQVDFLQPTHIKQDFIKTDRYNSFMTNLGVKLNDYFNEKTYGKSGGATGSATSKPEKWTWAMCEKCTKWRRLPLGFTEEDLPDMWYCHMNPDSTHSRCDIGEEPEDEDDVLCGRTGASYEKTVKKQIEHDKQKQREEEEKKKHDQAQKLKFMEHQVTALKKQLVSAASGAASHAAASALLNSPEDVALQEKLQESMRREEEQKKVIEQLKGQQKQIDRQRSQMRPMVLAGNLIARQPAAKPTSTSSSTPPTPRLIASLPIASTSTPPSIPTIPTAPHVKREPGESAAKRIKYEEGEKQVIVIDNSDDSDASLESVDIKPDVNQLNQALRGDKTPRVVTCTSSSQTKPVEISNSNLSDKDITRLDPLQQVDFIIKQDKIIKESKEKLTKLRSNVSKLLALIVPDVDLGDENNIDNILIEMIKVNSQIT